MEELDRREVEKIIFLEGQPPRNADFRMQNAKWVSEIFSIRTPQDVFLFIISL
jgi:hypothetical protein